MVYISGRHLLQVFSALQFSLFLQSAFLNFILLLVPSHKSSDGVKIMRRSKKDRQQLLTSTIKDNPFITDEELAEKFQVSVQTIRLDRLELSIPELRERIKTVAEKRFEDEVRSLPLEEVIGEIIHIETRHERHRVQSSNLTQLGLSCAVIHFKHHHPTF